MRDSKKEKRRVRDRPGVRSNCCPEAYVYFFIVSSLSAEGDEPRVAVLPQVVDLSRAGVCQRGCLSFGESGRSADLVVVQVLVIVQLVELVLECPVVVAVAVPDGRRQLCGFGVRSRVGEGAECGRVVSWPECRRAAARVPRCRHFLGLGRRERSPSKRRVTALSYIAQ